jgi:hypothetical protein
MHTSPKEANVPMQTNSPIIPPQNNLFPDGEFCAYHKSFYMKESQNGSPEIKKHLPPFQVADADC